MADLGIQQWLLDDDDAAALDVIVDELEPQAGGIVDVVQSVGDIGGDSDPRHPIGEDGEIRVEGIAEAIGEIGAGDVIVDEVDVRGGDGGALESDEAGVVAAADDGEAVGELIGVD